ncbi:MAG TPA: hypothetical protein VGF67_03450 [Ktedonobacteraceae bacterium]|jgi:hypothetical protein
MPSLRRSLLRRYRLFAPRLFRHGLWLLALLLLCDGIAALCFPQLQAALSLNVPAGQPQSGVRTLVVAPMTAAPNARILAADNFQRANQPYWGTASDGDRWQADANSLRPFAIIDHAGIVSTPTRPLTCTAVLGPGAANMDLTFSASLSRYGPSFLGAVLRWSDPGDFYLLSLDGRNLGLARAMDGMLTPLQAVTFPARAGASYTFRFRAVGAQLFAMVWPTGQPALSEWQIALTDDALSTGQAGIRVSTQSSAQVRVTAFMEVAL